MLIRNPIIDPLFLPVMIRMVIVLIAGFLIVLIFNIKNLKKTFESETWKRYFSWLIMAPTFIISIFLGKIPSLLILVFIIYKTAKEYSALLHLPRFYKNLILVNGGLSIVMAVFIPDVAYSLPIIYLIIIVTSSIIRNQLEDIFKHVAYALFASIWICYGLIHFVLIMQGFEYGQGVLLLLGFSVALCDVLAACIGKLFYKIGFGVKTTIAEQISPNKTYAGMIGTILGACIGVWLLSFTIQSLTLLYSIILVIIISVFSILGDLVESMVKRFSGVKDSGSSIAGHGGFLDRMDSLLLTVMATYYYFYIIGI